MSKADEYKAKSDENKSISSCIREPAVQKFSIEMFRQNCMKLFGVTSSTFDGAFYGITEKEMTLEEAQAIIDKWMNGGK